MYSQCKKMMVLIGFLPMIVRIREGVKNEAVTPSVPPSRISTRPSSALLCAVLMSMNGCKAPLRRFSAVKLGGAKGGYGGSSGEAKQAVSTPSP